MAEFNWDEENANPLDGYDTDVPETTETPIKATMPAPKAPILPKKALPKIPFGSSTQAQRAVDAILEESPTGELSEAEWRLEKAQYYRAILNSQLLSSDHPAAIEVEQELQEWAKRQLEVLLGIRTGNVVDNTTTPVSVCQGHKNQFEDAEVEALKLIASRVIAKGNEKPVQAVPAKDSITPVSLKPVEARQPPNVSPVATQSKEETPRRGRGRPRKYGCKICGKMICEHKQAAPTVTAPSTQNEVESTEDTFNGLPIQQDADGTKFVDAPNGIRYRLDLRTFTNRETGEQRQGYTPVEISRPQNDSLLKKPYPSEQEAIQLASAEAAVNLRKMQGNAGLNKILDLALKSPPKEEYIPTPPSIQRR